MKRYIPLFFLLFPLTFFLASGSFAHSGRTDSCGGHNDRKHGGYHIHNYSKYCTCYPNAPECEKKETVTNTGEIKKDDQSKSISPIDEWNCPETHLIKGNVNSMIYHLPNGTYYHRTKPEKCYATEEDARADGFRKSKR